MARLPFDVEFQKSLLRLLMEDQSFGYAATKHLAPEFFENEILAWMYRCIQQHQATYDTIPSLPVLMEATKSVGQANYPIYSAMVEQVSQASLRDHVWLRDQVLDFAKRNIFVRAFADGKELYNAGKVDEAYDLVMRRMDEVAATTWDPVDRTWFYIDLDQRQTMRHQRAQSGDAISTGFSWLDAILRGGLHIGELGVWMAYPKVGKALRNDQLVLTPTGWAPISELRVGDPIIGGSSGKTQKVLGVYPQGVVPLFEVAFSDGTKSIACGEHIWRVQTRKSRQRKSGAWVEVTTGQLKGLVESGKESGVTWVPSPPKIEGSGNPLRDIDPYVLGLLLGDGTLASTVVFDKPEPDLWDAIERRLHPEDSLHRFEDRNRVSIVWKEGRGGSFQSRTARELKRLGLLGLTAHHKFIPEAIFHASAKVRQAVLCGLCDTDGWCAGTWVEFSSASRQLAEGVASLTRSLGGHASITPKPVNGSLYWRVSLRLMGSVPVRSEKHKKKTRVRQKKRYRRVISVTPVKSAKATCITTDDPECLFVTNDYIVTHNTTMLVTLAIAAVRRGFKVLHIVLEGSRKLVEDRCDSAFLQEVYADVKAGNINAHKYSLAVKEYRLLHDSLVIRSFVDKFDITILDIDHELRDLERSYGWRPQLLVVDYADLMTGRHQSQYRSTTEAQRAAYKDCKRLTNQDYAMWTAAQAQRPKKDAFEDPHILKSDAAADTYDKVRVCDFWGSLNQTTVEKEAKVMRAHAELYRDNEANQTATLGCDLERMQIWQHPNATSFDASATVTPALGYVGPGQRTAF